MGKASSDVAAATAAYHGIKSRGLPSTCVPRLRLRPRQVPQTSTLLADSSVDDPGMHAARQPCPSRNGVAAEVHQQAQAVATRLVAPRSKEEVAFKAQLNELQRRVVDFRNSKDLTNEMRTRQAILECCVQLGDIDLTLKEAKAASERCKGTFLQADMEEVIRIALCALAKLQDGVDGLPHGEARKLGVVQPGHTSQISAEAAAEIKQLHRQVVDCRSSGDQNAEFQARKRIVQLCAAAHDVKHALAEARWASKRAWAAGDLDKIIKARELLVWTESEASQRDRSRSQHRAEAAPVNVMEVASPQRDRGRIISLTPPPSKLRFHDDANTVRPPRPSNAERLTPEAPTAHRWSYPKLPFSPTPIKAEGTQAYRLLQAVEQVVVSEVFQLQAIAQQRSLNASKSKHQGFTITRSDAEWLRAFAFEALEACRTKVNTALRRPKAPDALRKEWRQLDAKGKQDNVQRGKVRHPFWIWMKAVQQDVTTASQNAAKIANSGLEPAAESIGTQRKLEALSATLQKVDEEISNIAAQRRF